MSEKLRDTSQTVHGDISDGLVFLPEGEAVELARLHEALQQAEAWGEFKALASKANYREAVEWHNEHRVYEEDEDEVARMVGIKGFRFGFLEQKGR